MNFSQKPANFLQIQDQNTLLKREQYAVSLRKTKKQQIIDAKRRKQTAQAPQKSMQNQLNIEIQNQDFLPYRGYEKWMESSYREQQEILKKLSPREESQLVVQLTSKDLCPIENLAVFTHIRMLISQNKKFNKIDFSSGFCAKLSQILEIENENDEIVRCLKIEASWILTNIMAEFDGKQIQEFLGVNQSSILKNMKMMMDSSDLQMADQAIECLSNIVGTPDLKISGSEFILILRNQAQNALKISEENNLHDGHFILKNIIWCFQNMTRYYSKSLFNQKNQILEVAKIFIQFQNDGFVLGAFDILLNLLAEDQNLQIGTEFVKSILNYLRSPNPQLIEKCLIITGQITSNSNETTDTCLGLGLLPTLDSLLEPHQSQAIILKSLWCLSNVTAGTQDQIVQFLQIQSLCDKIVALMKIQIPLVRKEALRIFCNLLSTTECLRTVHHVSNIPYLLDNFGEGLHLQDADIILELLNSIEIMLKLDNEIPLHGEDMIKFKIEMCGLLDNLEELQIHPNKKIYEKVVEIINDYLDVENQSEFE